MRLLIDLDEAVCDFLGGLCARYNSINGTTYDVSDFHHYDLSKVMGPRVRDYFLCDGFFSQLQAYPNAVEVLTRLVNDGFEVLVVTDALGSPEAEADKFHWLKRNLPFLFPTNTVLASRKDIIRADLMFDDSPRHLDSFPGIRVVMDRPYNKEVQGCRVFNNDWLEFERLVRTLSANTNITNQSCPNKEHW